MPNLNTELLLSAYILGSKSSSVIGSVFCANTGIPNTINAMIKNNFFILVMIINSPCRAGFNFFQ